MKKFQGSIFFALLAALLLLGNTASASPPVDIASETETEAEIIAIYQPIKKKAGIGRVFDWGLAKLETIIDGDLVSDLITTFIDKCGVLYATMIHSFKDMTLSYNELHEKEMERLGQFDGDFKDLVKLRHKIDRKCLYSSDVEERSLCIEKGIEIHDKIQDLRSQRSKTTDAIGRYDDMIEWCASYNNWFC